MKTLNEIADDLDEAQNSLVLWAQLMDPERRGEVKAELRAEDGRVIDLRDLANQLRQRAMAGE